MVTKKYAAGATLKSGELAVQEKSGETFTLPSAATADQVIAMFSTVAELKVTSASEIVGDFQAAATCKLTTNQHLLVQSTGVKWVILAGEPKREQGYGAVVERTSGTEYEPSATRLTQVILFATGGIETTLAMAVKVGAQSIGEPQIPKGPASPKISFSFICPPGAKWTATLTGSSTFLGSYYLTL